MEDVRAPSPAVDRALTVLETLVEAKDPLILTDLAKRAGIPLATCASIMRTLELRGYAARRVVGRSHYWRATYRLYSLASQLVRDLDLAAVSQPHLRALAEELHVPAHVGVLEGPTVVYVAKAAPNGFIQFNTYPGKVSPFNLTALGKAIAAYLPPHDLAAILDHLELGTGPKSLGRDPSRLLDDLAAVRVHGYAVEDEEEEAGISCVAAPIFGADERCVASIGVTGFAADLMLERLESALSAVRREARAISRKLGYPK